MAVKGKKPILLHRLTIRFFNSDFLPFLNNSETAKKYDILAILPESTLAIQNVLKSGFKADVICFDPECVKDVRWSRKLYMQCVQSEMFFEIPYAPCIRDTTARRRIIAQAHNYHAVGKAKSILVSSEALTSLELRSPHDVANLGYIFGLNEQQGKDAVKQNGIQVVQNSAGRKLGPYRVLVQQKENMSEHDAWKVPDEISDESSSSEEDET